MGVLLVSFAFLMRFLTICTAFSALPFDWGYVGDDVVCLNPYSSLNVLNSVEEY